MAPGWSTYDEDYNNDNVLDTSERNAASLDTAHDEAYWREKLHDLGQEDDIDGTTRSAYLHDGGSSALPRRWQQAGELDGRAPERMGDEEYAEWLREGMESRRRKRGRGDDDDRSTPRMSRRQEDRIKAEKRRAQDEASERAQRRKAKAERRRTKAECEEYHNLLEERKQWARRWAEAKRSDKKEGSTYFSDIAWPVRPPRDDQPLRLDKESIASFLVGGPEGAPEGYPDWLARRQKKEAKRRKHDTTAGDEEDSSPPKDLLRTALLVFHPDRFFSSPLYASLSEVGRQKAMVHDCVIRVAQVLSELVEERRRDKQGR
ncbi:hypothetical protein BDZ90DRAFT_70115 [Jaminaea rosea]|uniref:Uncharacterized protein n=1 Tax=Jaminaea rosea TaxID=1569628 RepID=A0A316UK59_9BASI|nr:hypothetical protein BDZ90DRAFT_70115 [Jaminaea rosea]PWN25637.1 hypothetical protein BDZ90DRAFT_70115 [Jaminaea rosea]